VIVDPELFLEVGQKTLMVSHEGGELLVMAYFMDPAQGLKPGKIAELRRIIREQDGNEGRLGLGVIGGECGCNLMAMRTTKLKIASKQGEVRSIALSDHCR